MLFDNKLFSAAFLLLSVGTVNCAEYPEQILDGVSKKLGCGKDRCALWGPPPRKWFAIADGKIVTGTAAVTDGTTDAKFAAIEMQTSVDKDALCQICLSPPTGTVTATAGQPSAVSYVLGDMKCKGENTGNGNYMTGEVGKFEFSNVPVYKLIPALFWYDKDAKQTVVGDNYWCSRNFENFVDPCCLESSAPSAKPTTASPTSKAPTTKAPTTKAPTTKAPTTASPKSNPCFSDTATVEVQGKGKVTMKALQVGDVVLTPSGYEKVYTIDHRSDYKITDFIQIHTAVEEPLEVTATHLLFVQGKNDPVEARSIVVGDELQGLFNGKLKSVEVQQITSVSKRGLYNPITTSGTIIVNGLVTSTYTAVNVSNGSNYLTVGGFKVMSMHDFMHLAMFPFKTICMTLSDAGMNDFCTASEGNEHNKYNQIGLQLIAFGKAQNNFVQSSILVGLIGVFVFLNIASSPLFLLSIIVTKVMLKKQKN